MLDVGLLTPGVGDGDPDDLAVLRAMIRAEVAWVEATGSAAEADAVRDAADRVLKDELRFEALARAVAIDALATGNPVMGLVRALQAGVPEAARAAIHRNLTSQDIVDTAMMITVRDGATLVIEGLDRTCASLARMARTYRDQPVLAHTLGQAALPTTFGARAAGWLHGIAQARSNLADVTAGLPVAFGGAVGTMDGVSFDDVTAWAGRVGLTVPVAPWHVHRGPVTRVAAALTEVCVEVGSAAGDVLAGTRPEVGELKEPQAEGRGASTAMPFKANPMLSILIRRSALVAPHLLAQTTAAAALAVDERPDGAWHTEWEAVRGLTRHAVVVARCAAQLMEGLTFDQQAAQRNLDRYAPAGATTGNAGLIVDRILDNYAKGLK